MSRHAEMSAESRARLIGAAWDLFAEQGARRTTVQEIADRSGISRGSVAWHFGSKQGLVIAVVDAAFDWLVEQLNAQLADTSGDGWARVIEAQSRLMVERRYQIFATVGVEALVDEDEILDRFAAGQQRVRMLYANHFHEHDLLPAGVDPVEVAGALRALTLGLNIQHRFDHSVLTPRDALHALRAVISQLAPEASS